MLVKTLVFALHLAPNRIAICTKSHCNLHQNALQFAPKRIAICTKTQTKDMKIGCKGLFINKLALKGKKRLGGFWQST